MDKRVYVVWFSCQISFAKLQIPNYKNELIFWNARSVIVTVISDRDRPIHVINTVETAKQIHPEPSRCSANDFNAVRFDRRPEKEKNKLKKTGETSRRSATSSPPPEPATMCLTINCMLIKLSHPRNIEIRFHNWYLTAHQQYNNRPGPGPAHHPTEANKKYYNQFQYHRYNR